MIKNFNILFLLALSGISLIGAFAPITYASFTNNTFETAGERNGVVKLINYGIWSPGESGSLTYRNDTAFVTNKTGIANYGFYMVGGEYGFTPVDHSSINMTIIYNDTSNKDTFTNFTLEYRMINNFSGENHEPSYSGMCVFAGVEKWCFTSERGGDFRVQKINLTHNEETDVAEWVNTQYGIGKISAGLGVRGGSHNYKIIWNGTAITLFVDSAYSGAIAIGEMQSKTFNGIGYVLRGINIEQATDSYTENTDQVWFDNVSLSYSESVSAGAFTNVSIAWDSIPANWTFGETTGKPILYWYLYGGTSPFNMTIYEDNNIKYNNIIYGNSSMDWYSSIGNHSLFMIVNDITGTEKSSNGLNFTVYPTSSLSNTYFYLNKSSFSIFDDVGFYTSGLSGGTPPYKVYVYALMQSSLLGYADSINTYTCENVLENGVCTGSFKAQILSDDSDGNIPMYALIRDSENHFAQTNTVIGQFGKVDKGTNLTVIFTTTGNLTSDDITHLYANISGGVPPYEVHFYDDVDVVGEYDNPAYFTGNELCVFNGYKSFYDLQLYAYMGGHKFRVSVLSADGQVYNTNYQFLNIGASTKFSTEYNRDIVMNCLNSGGTIGDNVYTPEVLTSTEGNGTSETPYTPISDLNKGITSFINVLSTPIVIWTIILGIVAGLVEKATNTGGKAMLIIFIIGFNVLAGFNVIPRWIILIEVVILALIFGLKMKGGG